MKKVFRTDVGAQVTGTMTNIQRIDSGPTEHGWCGCYRGVGELAGQDECHCVEVDHSDPSGPKFRSKPYANSDAGEKPYEKARREMEARHRDAWKGDHTPELPYTTPATPSAMTSAASLEDVRMRERAERDVNATRMGLLVCPACGGESATCRECNGQRYVLAKDWTQNSNGTYSKKTDDAADALRDHLASRGDAPRNDVASAYQDMVERNRTAWKRTPAAPTQSAPARGDSGESPLERAKREMQQRHGTWRG